MTYEEMKLFYKALQYFAPGLRIFSEQRPIIVSGPFMGHLVFVLLLPVGYRGASVSITVDRDGCPLGIEYPKCFGRISNQRMICLDAVIRWAVARMCPDKAPPFWPRTATDMVRQVWFPKRYQDSIICEARKADAARIAAEHASKKQE